MMACECSCGSTVRDPHERIRRQRPQHRDRLRRRERGVEPPGRRVPEAATQPGTGSGVSSLEERSKLRTLDVAVETQRVPPAARPSTWRLVGVQVVVDRPPAGTRPLAVLREPRVVGEQPRELGGRGLECRDAHHHDHQPHRSPAGYPAGANALVSRRPPGLSSRGHPQHHHGYGGSRRPRQPWNTIYEQDDDFRKRIVDGLPVVDDDLPKVTKQIVALSHGADIPENEFGFTISTSDLEDGVLIPRYYDRSYVDRLVSWATDHDCRLVSPAQLVEGGVIEIFRGHGGMKSQWYVRDGSGVPYIRTSNIGGLEIEYQSRHVVRVPEEIYTRVTSRKRKVQARDLVLVRRGEDRIGDVA